MARGNGKGSDVSSGWGSVGSAFIISDGEHTHSAMLCTVDPCWLNE